MKTVKLIQTLGLALTLSVSAAALAYGNDDRHFDPAGPALCDTAAFQQSLRYLQEINARRDRQHDRVVDGFYERRINPNEFRRLMDEQNHIRQMERGFLADGMLSPPEYRELVAALDAASRHIFREGHDAQ